MDVEGGMKWMLNGGSEVGVERVGEVGVEKG